MKRSISLILAIAVMFCFCMTPVFADDEATETTTTAAPTGTVTASLEGDVEPAAGEAFVVSLDFSDISTNLFKGGQIQFNWPADVASLYDSDYDIVVSTDTVASGDTAAEYAVVINDTTLGRNNKYTSQMSFDIEAGTGDVTLYNASTSDKAPTELTDGTFHFCSISFIMGEDQSYDDFYFTITFAECSFNEETTGAENFSTLANGDITAVGIKSSGALKEVTVDGVTYSVVSDNAVPYGGFEDENGDFTMGTWQSPQGDGYFDDISSSYFYAVDKATDEAELYDVSVGVTLESDDYALGTRWNDGATGLCSLANFIAVEAGKTYYISYEYKHKTSGDLTYIVTSFKTSTDDFDDGTNLGKPDDATTEWQTAEYVYTAEEDGYVYFHFRWLGDSTGNNAGEGPYWYFDNFNVYEVESEETEEPTDEETEAPSEDESEEETEAPSEDESEEETEAPSEEETEEPTEATTYPEGAIVADTTLGANDSDAAYEIESITSTGTISFKLVTDENATNMLLAFTGNDILATTPSGYSYFQNSGIMFLVADNGTSLKYRNGNSNTTFATLVPGEEYTFEVSVDVASQTYSVVVTDADGAEVATLTDIAFRFIDNAETAAIDTLLFYEYDQSGATELTYTTESYIYDLVVVADEEETDEPTDEETDEPTEAETIPAASTKDTAEAVEIDAVTTTGTIEFTATVDTTSEADTVISLTDSSLSDSSEGIQLVISGSTLSYVTEDGTTEVVGELESDVEYSFSITVDVDNQVYSVVVTDSEGTTVATVPTTSFTTSGDTITAIDAIVFYTDGDDETAASAGTISSVTVTTDSDAEEDVLPITVDLDTYVFDSTTGTYFVSAKLVDGAEAPTDNIVAIISIVKDGKPVGVSAANVTLDGVSNLTGYVADYAGGTVAAVSFVSGVYDIDLLPITNETTDLGTPVGVYYPAE